MSLMVAAPREVLKRHQALLVALSSQVFRISEGVGDGAKTKLVNNLLVGINLVAAAEALALAERLGFDLAATLGAIKLASGQSGIGSDRVRRALTGVLVSCAQVTLLEKDTRLALAAAAAAGFAGPLDEGHRSRFCTGACRRAGRSGRCSPVALVAGQALTGRPASDDVSSAAVLSAAPLLVDNNISLATVTWLSATLGCFFGVSGEAPSGSQKFRNIALMSRNAGRFTPLPDEQLSAVPACRTAAGVWLDRAGARLFPLLVFVVSALALAGCQPPPPPLMVGLNPWVGYDPWC